jgi:hypothetical protein
MTEERMQALQLSIAEHDRRIAKKCRAIKRLTNDDDIHILVNDLMSGDSNGGLSSLIDPPEVVAMRAAARARDLSPLTTAAHDWADDNDFDNITTFARPHIPATDPDPTN